MRFFVCLLFFGIASCYAEKLVIAFEPFPPFITEQRQGLTVDMLREIEKISDLSFDIKIMTYARAKHELKHGRIDIAGHTPKNIETDDFYQYALELEWQIQTTSDLFSFDADLFNSEQLKLNKIGTTTGNASFFAEQLGVDKSVFTEVRTLNQLVEMFIKKRIDLILFERASVMTLLAQKNVYGVHYQSIGIIPASMAVSNNAKGRALKKRLDTAIKQLDLDALFSGYLKYIYLPSPGVTSIMTEKN
ncbi:transporter substrate-binding domain-containing protein [Thalassotalea sp. G2M2-11]|uniref:substrate-binding periplasmic protein n=1 Tax=Thalassotalea sp. G2M2-11 TaxID=2787627 RepID=UPI0019D0F267|nr:transporter substrate-binding domain-containing protein [Thalassotalea sp. G2M2-11]